MNEIVEEALDMGEENACKDCTEEKMKTMGRDCRGCGRGTSKEENTYALVGMDAVALFPSLSGKTTASIVRKKVMENEV